MDLRGLRKGFGTGARRQEGSRVRAVQRRDQEATARAGIFLQGAGCSAKRLRRRRRDRDGACRHPACARRCSRVRGRLRGQALRLAVREPRLRSLAGTGLIARGRAGGAVGLSRGQAGGPSRLFLQRPRYAPASHGAGAGRCARAGRHPHGSSWLFPEGEKRRRNKVQPLHCPVGASRRRTPALARLRAGERAEGALRLSGRAGAPELAGGWKPRFTCRNAWAGEPVRSRRAQRICWTGGTGCPDACRGRSKRSR